MSLSRGAGGPGWPSSLPWVVIGLAVGFVVSQLRRRRSSPPAPPPPAPRGSIHAELVPVPYPRPLCDRCGYKIRLDREGEFCWLVAIEGKFFYLHRACADERGNPL